MTRMLAISATGIAVLGLALAWFLGRGGEGDAFASCRATAVAGGAQIGGPFELVNSAGQTVTDADIITEPTLIYFGYTYCPDVCPLDTVRNAEIVDLLSERGISTTPVFISIDPERDTPEIVGEFAENLHEKMVGLTGSEAQVAAASKSFRTYYKKNDGDPDYYLVDHSTFSYLVLPEHGFVEFYRRDLTADAVAESVQCFVKNA